MKEVHTQFAWAVTPSPKIASYSNPRIKSFAVPVWLWQSGGWACVRWRFLNSRWLDRAHHTPCQQPSHAFWQFRSGVTPLFRLQIMLSVSGDRSQASNRFGPYCTFWKGASHQFFKQMFWKRFVAEDPLFTSHFQSQKGDSKCTEVLIAMIHKSTSSEEFWILYNIDLLSTKLTVGRAPCFIFACVRMQFPCGMQVGLSVC